MSTDPNLNDTDYELLSAYIDGVLSDSERSALEMRLRDDSLLRGELNALRQTVSLINQLPTLKAPRDFTLTPEMVGIRLVEKTRRPLVFPVLQFASAIAAMVMIVFAVTMLFSEDDRPTTMSSEQASDADVALQSTLEAGVAFTNSGELSTEERLTAVFMGTESASVLRSSTVSPTQRQPSQSTVLTLTALAEHENEAPQDSNTGGGAAEMTLPEADFDDSSEPDALVQTDVPPSMNVFDATTNNNDPESVDDGSADDMDAVEVMAVDEAEESMPTPNSPLPAASPTIFSSPLPPLQMQGSATPVPSFTLLPDVQEEQAVTLADTEVTTSDMIVEVTEEIMQEPIIDATQDTSNQSQVEEDDDNVLAMVLLIGGLGLLIIVALSWWIPRRNKT